MNRSPLGYTADTRGNLKKSTGKNLKTRCYALRDWRARQRAARDRSHARFIAEEEGSMRVAQLRPWSAIAFSWVIFLSAVIATPPGAAAQELYGSVVGTVQDGSGARIPGATVALVNRDTNLTLTAISNETGSYTFANVLPGTYDVKVSLEGFKEFVKQQVPVRPVRSAASMRDWKSASSPKP
jgi:carboxypeptidase family protein